MFSQVSVCPWGGVGTTTQGFLSLKSFLGGVPPSPVTGNVSGSAGGGGGGRRGTPARTGLLTQ